MEKEKRVNFYVRNLKRAEWREKGRKKNIKNYQKLQIMWTQKKDTTQNLSTTCKDKDATQMHTSERRAVDL